jgi:hypothetical protein
LTIPFWKLKYILKEHEKEERRLRKLKINKISRKSGIQETEKNFTIK